MSCNVFCMTESILYLNVVLHLNHEKCVGNELHIAPFGDLEAKRKGKQIASVCRKIGEKQ